MNTIAEIMTLAPVIPVIVVDELAHAEPLARALVAGGLPVLEVTLRTPCALDAIRAMKRVPGAIVGAGTVTGARDLALALDAGSAFIVSPGLTEPLGKAAIGAGIPFLPGIANAASAPPAGSRLPMRPNGWRSTRCCASAAAGSRPRACPMKPRSSGWRARLLP